ncbi:hypothetical protein ACHAWU_006135 [Discostella pseudostelligera]|uniref:Uncharacterized protein n=1 Tax=Discostella pseudostelligera TaxID=259834 RepID=A0ABD3M2B3_9STRA
MVTSNNINISTRRGGDATHQRHRSILRRRFLLVPIFIVVIGFYALSFRFLLTTTTPTLSTNKELRMIEPSIEPVAVIAHAISLIKCSKGSSVTGFLDAAAILRHSIHKNSIHHNSFPSTQINNSTTAIASATTTTTTSRYSYQMYAIVHTSCAEHSTVLSQLGYTILIKDHPVKKEDIKGEWLRNHIESENCCGSAEFIKLYAYQLTNHPIVVHWDMDVAVLHPLDDLYDVMIYPSSHPIHLAARERIERQHPEEVWPERIDAFFTRDVTSAKPWEKVLAVQGGFLVARPDIAVFDAYIEFIKEGNYIGGRGDGTGWAGLGYGGFQGAMAYQGVVAYYYDQLRPNSAVELNVCRWNQVAADVLWRGPERKEEHHLQCREYPKLTLPDGTPDYASNTNCDDCRNTPIELVRTVHYTACKKPWECTMAHPRIPRDKRQSYRLENLVNVTYCGHLVREWFELRREFEMAMERASDGQVKRPSLSTGGYEEEYFLGYCQGKGGYIAMEPPPRDFDIRKMYGM